MAVVTLAQVRSRLNKTAPSPEDDADIEDMIDAAEAEYASVVGPLPGSKTVRLDGGPVLILPPGSTAVTAAAYSSGTTIPLTDLDLDPDAAILHGRFAAGSRNVVLTVTIGPLPPNHREAIAADVAGYFAATQRGGQRSALPAEGYAEGFGQERTTPLTLWPRIRALAWGGFA